MKEQRWVAIVIQLLIILVGLSSLFFGMWSLFGVPAISIMCILAGTAIGILLRDKSYGTNST